MNMLQPLRDPLKLFTDQVITPASYIIFKDDAGRVYAKNGKTGAIEFSGTDAATVIQQAIDNTFAQGGGQVYLKGKFSISKTIYLYPTVFLVGAGPGWPGEFYGSTLIGAFDGTVIEIRANSGKVANTGILNLAIRPSNTANGIGIKTNDVNGNLKDLFIQNVMIGYGGSHGIYLDSPSLKAWLSNVYVEYCGGAGIYITSGGLRADKLYAYGNKYGIYSPNIGDTVLSESQILSNSNGGIIYEGTATVGAISLFQTSIANNGYRQISISNTNVQHLSIIGSKIIGRSGNDYLIYLGGAGILGQIIANYLYLNGATNYIYAAWPGGLSIIYNLGYYTKMSGTATIPAGSTSVTVKHSLSSTPNKVIVTPRGNIGNVWVSARDSTYITINCSTAPTSDVIVDWYAEV